MAVLSKFLTVNFKNYARAFDIFLEDSIQDSEAIVKFLESKEEKMQPILSTLPDKELVISHCNDKTWFFKDVRRIIDEKSVNVEDVLKKFAKRDT